MFRSVFRNEALISENGAILGLGHARCPVTACTLASWRRLPLALVRRTGDALPGQAQRVVEEGR
jgi:hypothetical protein